MKNNKVIKTYGIIGQVLCGCAGTIIGFMSGGIGLAILGFFPGMFVGYILEKSVMGTL